MKKIFRYTLLAAFSLSAMNANAAPLFDIIVEYKPAGEIVDNGAGDPNSVTQAFSGRQIQLFGAAELFWESVLTGFQGIPEPTYNLQAWLTPEDGPDGSLAFAGPREFEDISGFDRATAGIMQFDADDFGPDAPFPQTEQLFLDSAVHEIAHALGFGTQFSFNGLLDVDDNYIGAQALAAFNTTNSTSETFISMEIGGGHWNECWVKGLFEACSPEDGMSPDPDLFNDTELMTPFAVDVPATFSAATIAAFRDLGYLTIDPFTQGIAVPLAANIPANVPVPSPALGSLILASMLGLYVSGRRRRS
jgi:hypothetical protein